MPSAELLKGLSTFEKASSSSHGGAAAILSQLGADESLPGPTDPQKTISKLVPVGAGLPVLLRKLVDQILAGQCIDFSELPPAKGRTRTLPNHEGHIIVVRAKDLSGTRRLIPDFATWVQCYSLYMAVITSKEPDRTSNLLAYMESIAKASVKYTWPSWVVYDQNYRQ